MSGANADRPDRAGSADEWRVYADEPAKPAADPPGPEGEWSRAAVSQHRDRVNADLSSWREELTERMRRLDQRLKQASDSPD